MGHFISVTDSDLTVNKVYRDWLRQPYVEQPLTGNCALTAAAKLPLQWAETVTITFYQIPLSRDLKSAVCQVV
jgi:hypothetical protein